MTRSHAIAALAALSLACSGNKSSSGSSASGTGATGSTSTTSTTGTAGSSGNTDTTGTTGSGSGSSGSTTGSSGSSGSSGSTGNDAGFVIANHPPMPQVQNSGGPVLTAPVITAVTFDGDPLRGQLEGFVQNIGASSYWAAALPEYGVGPATAGPPLELAANGGPGDGGATFDDTDIQKWLIANLSGGDGGWGPPANDAIYSLFFPSGTTITYQSNTLCQQGSLGGAIGGYHGYVVVPDGGAHVAYAVIPRCGGNASSAIDDTTSTASHEFGEASTDPYQDDAGYLTVAPEDFAWSVAGGEIGDLCELRPDANYYDQEIGAEVQRLWSNHSAAASHDPCLPILPDAGPFFCSAPVLSTINIPLSGLPPFKALKMSVGQTKTVELDLWSDAPMPAWSAIPYDVATLFGEDAGFSFDPPILSGANGDALNVNVTLLRTPDLGPYTGAFAVISAPQGATNTSAAKCIWPVLVYAGP